MNRSIIKKIVGAVAVAVVMCGVVSTGCGGGGGKSLNSAEDLKAYLDKQPANSPDKPIRVSMKLNEQMFRGVGSVISNSSKYVSLDLTGSPLTEIPDEAFGRNSYGNDECPETLVGLTIPNSITAIGRDAFVYCDNLASITIGANVDIRGHRTFRNLEHNFRDAYNEGDKQAGTYILNNNTWTKQ